MTSTSVDARRSRASRSRVAAAAHRHGGLAVRRPRRRDQRHAPADPGARGGGDPPRAQPRRRRGRPGRDPGGRGRGRGQLVPGRARRVLPLHGRDAARGRRRRTSACSAAAAARSRRPRSRSSRRSGSSGSTTRTTGSSSGSTGMIDDLVERARGSAGCLTSVPEDLLHGSTATTSRSPRCCPRSRTACSWRDALDERLDGEWSARGAGVPVVGITGTGGAGKSTVTDEILARLLAHVPRALRSPSSRSTRPAGAPAARCSATGSG